MKEIREIRDSERRFYQKITDIYATVMDYSAYALTTGYLCFNELIVPVLKKR